MSFVASFRKGQHVFVLGEPGTVVRHYIIPACIAHGEQPRVGAIKVLLDRRASEPEHEGTIFPAHEVVGEAGQIVGL
jgi:hypothetical protein